KFARLRIRQVSVDGFFDGDGLNFFGAGRLFPRSLQLLGFLPATCLCAFADEPTIQRAVDPFRAAAASPVDVGLLGAIGGVTSVDGEHRRAVSFGDIVRRLIVRLLYKS